MVPQMVLKAFTAHEGIIADLPAANEETRQLPAGQQRGHEVDDHTDEV